MSSVYDDATPRVAPDDADQGILDRGYIVDGEKKTTDARELDDIARGQLEDASEAINSPVDAGKHHAFHAAALYNLGRTTESLRSILQGLRRDSNNIDLLISLAVHFGIRDWSRWRRKVLEKAVRLAPDHAAALYALSECEFADGNLMETRAALDKAMLRWDFYIDKFPLIDLLMARAVVAGVMNDQQCYADMLERIRQEGFQTGPIEEAVAAEKGRIAALKGER
jgi:tetratricopeptide (TPR) repeat protein